MTTHTMKKRTIYIAAGSIILLLLAGIISKQIIENQIEQALVREVDQRTAGLYHLQVERTTLGLIKRSVTLEKICLIADTTRLISQGESHFISQINIAQLTATKIDWQKNASDLMLSCISSRCEIRSSIFLGMGRLLKCLTTKIQIPFMR